MKSATLIPQVLHSHRTDTGMVGYTNPTKDRNRHRVKSATLTLHSYYIVIGQTQAWLATLTLQSTEIDKGLSPSHSYHIVTT